MILLTDNGCTNHHQMSWLCYLINKKTSDKSVRLQLTSFTYSFSACQQAHVGAQARGTTSAKSNSLDSFPPDRFALRRSCATQGGPARRLTRSHLLFTKGRFAKITTLLDIEGFFFHWHINIGTQ